jgi:hypothetical protein
MTPMPVFGLEAIIRPSQAPLYVGFYPNSLMDQKNQLYIDDRLHLRHVETE